MKTLPIGKHDFALVDDDVFEHVAQWRWGLLRGGYAFRVAYDRDAKGKQKSILLHRLIMDAPKGVQVDHINRNRLDCRKENLRLCDNRQNQRNAGLHPCNKTGFKGVLPCGKNWKSAIKLPDRIKHLGVFSTKEAAARAYDKAAHELDPEFCRLNFEDGIWTAEQLAPFLCEMKQPASGFKGVSRRGNGWTAVVHFRNSSKRLGQFDTAEAAAEAVRIAKLQPTQ